jgi:ribose/xylose/arabinose/galactoside ABC-type transport system permease subunit
MTWMDSLAVIAPPSRGRDWRRFVLDYSPWFLAALLAAVGTSVTPLFLTPANILDVLQQSAIIGVLTIGQFLVILTGGIDLSLGSLLALSAMVGAIGLSHGIVVGILASLVTCGVLGALSGLLVAKGGLPPFIVTFGMMAAARGAALTLTSGTPINLNGSSFEVIGTSIWPETIWAVVILAVYILLDRFRTGRHIYAIGGNIDAAKVSGINTSLLLVAIYAISGLCAAIGGLIFMARSTVALPTSGAGYELQTIAACVLGGTDLFGGEGRLAGAVIGIIILTMLSNILDLTGVNPFWDYFAVGLTLWLSVVLRSRLVVRR